MKLKNFLAVLLMIMSFTACDEDTLNTIKELNLKMTFYYDGTEITDLKNVIHLNGTGTLAYTLDSVAFDALDITAKILEKTSSTKEDVTINFDSKSNKGTIIISSTLKEEVTLEVTVKNNGKVIRTYQLKITNFIAEEEDKRPRISLDALAGEGEIYNVHIPFHSESIPYFYELSVIAEGIYANEQNLNVNISIDSDTLEKFNQEKFGFRNDLRYKQLPDSYYSCPIVCHIPEGINTQKLPIEFKNMTNLDMSKRWILPVTIKKDPSYILNMENKKHRAFLNIISYNNYSGTYSSTEMKIYVRETTNDPATVDTRTAFAIDAQTIFFYAGTTWMEDKNRDKYKVIVEFGEGVKDEDGIITGPIVVQGNTDNEAQITPFGECTYKRSITQHTTQPHINVETTTLYISYYYTDVTSNPAYPIRYRVTGSMTMQRSINTLIPDKDQAIIW